MNTNDLVIKGYKLSRKKGITFEDVDGSFLYEGIEIINSILDVLSADGIGVPFNSTFTFNLSSDKTDYFVGPDSTNDIVRAKPVAIEYATVKTSNINNPITIISEADYYRNPRNTEYTGVPGELLPLQDVDRMVLKFPSKPSGDYEVTIVCRDKFSDLDPQQELTGLPDYYLRFLQYALARELTQMYGLPWSDVSEDSYQSLLSLLKSTKPMDLRVRRSHIMSLPYGRFGCYRGYINGW